MKKRYLLILKLFLLIQCLNSSGQDELPSLSDLSFIKKGNIRLFDGTDKGFTNLSLDGDSVEFYCSNSIAGKYSVESVALISSEKSNVEKGAIVGGISGLLAGTLAAGIANSDNSVLELIGGVIKGEDVSGSLNQDQVPFIVGGTLLGVAVGALIGSKGSRITIYDRNSKVYCQPALAFKSGPGNAMLLSVELNFE